MESHPFLHSCVAAGPAKGDPRGGSKEVAPRTTGLPGAGHWDSPQILLCVFPPGWRWAPPPPSVLLPHSSASCGCTQACQYTSGITTLRKPDQPIATGAGPPLWEVPSMDLLPEGIGNTLMGQGSSWGTDFGAGLISTASGTGPPRLPSSYRRRAPHWPWPNGGPGLMDRPHSHLDGGWGVRLEMTPNTNKTHLHHESIYQQVRCWSAWFDFQPFPGIVTEIWVLQIIHSGKRTLGWHEKWAKFRNECPINEALDQNKTWIWTARIWGYHQCQVESIYVFIYYIYISFFRNATLQLTFKKLIEK